MARKQRYYDQEWPPLGSSVKFDVICLFRMGEERVGITSVLIFPVRMRGPHGEQIASNMRMRWKWYEGLPHNDICPRKW
jgi:hypothetical protein